MPTRRTFRQILAEAVAELSASGYSSQERIEYWLRELKEAAEREIGPEWQANESIHAQMDAIYRKLVDREGVAKYVPGVNRFTLAMIRPELRNELDRRILASASLIKLHREEAINKTLQRFSGWSTSIPAGAASEESRREVTKHVGKALVQYKFEKRRVAIDQGAKLIANISDIVASDNGAIAAIWHHVHRGPGYQARPAHVAREGKIYAIRDSWAWKEGLINRTWPTTDSFEMVAQLPYCSCSYEYVVSPRRLPDAMLTKKGKNWIKEGQAR